MQFLFWRLEDLYETIQCETQGDRILPLVTNPGRIMLTCKRLYFQPFNNIEKVIPHFLTIQTL